MNKDNSSCRSLLMGSGVRFTNIRVNKMLRSLWAAIVAVLILAGEVTFFGAPIHALAASEGPGVYANAYLVVDMSTGTVYCEKNASEDCYIGSFAMLVSAMTALDLGISPMQEMTFSKEAAETAQAGDRDLKLPMSEGEVHTAQDLMAAMVLESSIPCAYSFAESVTKTSAQDFTPMMNQKIRDLQAPVMVYSDCTGRVHEGAIANMCDMMTIFVNCIGREPLAKLLSAGEYVIEGRDGLQDRTLTADNLFLTGEEECEGIEYGFVAVDQGETLAMANIISRNDRRLIVLIEGSPEDLVYEETRVLADYAFGVAEGRISERSFDESVEASEPINVKMSKDIELYEFDQPASAILQTLPKGYVVSCTGIWNNIARVELYDHTVGYILEMNALARTAEEISGYDPGEDGIGDNNPSVITDSEPTEIPSQQGEETPAPTPTTITSTPAPEGNQSSYNAVVADRIADKKKLDNMTIIAIGVLIVSIIGLYTVNRKN